MPEVDYVQAYEDTKKLMGLCDRKTFHCSASDREYWFETEGAMDECFRLLRRRWGLSESEGCNEAYCDNEEGFPDNFLLIRYAKDFMKRVIGITVSSDARYAQVRLCFLSSYADKPYFESILNGEIG